MLNDKQMAGSVLLEGRVTVYIERTEKAKERCRRTRVENNASCTCKLL